MLKYILLGIIQGTTEFLPVSSSGHLVILQNLFGITGNEIAVSIILHLATTLALIVFFFKDIVGLLRNLRLLVLILTVTVITGGIGILGKDFFEKLFHLPKFIAGTLVITGIILILSRRFMQGRRNTLTLKDAFLLGLSQGFAIIPGISRSGITLCALLFRKMDRESSFRLSFLASIPVVLGAAILEAREIDFALGLESGKLILAFMVAFLVGIISLRILKIILEKAKLHYFGYYCIFMGIILFLFMR
ncbi:MAG: undecaprenyl-diphosphate phosphatase [Candidatus Omnitrophica bacterium]|nr:undecaprenyl-diphosphate phosphatase [Candidatus Omnitrophota bacterium]MBU4346305.1 undecaprenyl-diphosphate phosphatase [Candidatus Omnitrophota bacterium]MBU4473205.1 undecaprenyl-diphosphate phosphatase [Candidatus Omnitrophota bacterium]MCG2706568.1 undecaprenyl-diphosphate phosphatase [Candidatus Omnitrophota bacterium]